ncbi:MAG TPA: aminotransferase class V-fold PLP-dependent enzyme [Planctomycetota bacterium]|nr:aminotransferase class V-fold PLP-dependent enzyme [Planctomycetota bacterium]
MSICYLDNNATTRVAPEVFEAMRPWFTESFGNPSSLHSLGQEAADAVQSARASIARLIGARSPEEIVFTSGGTESDNSAIRAAVARYPKRRRIVTSAVEHEAVLAPLAALEAQGYEILRIAPDQEGRFAFDDFSRAIDERTALVALMGANNETGVVHEIERVGALCAERDVPFHVDAVQVAGKRALAAAKLPLDTLAISAHKLHGPKGIGALYLRDSEAFEPLLCGGGQEQERRSGTENVPGIVGFGRAAELALQWLAKQGPSELARKRDRLETAMLDRVPGSRVHARQALRTCNTTSLGFDAVSGEALVMLLSEYGICASAGSACASARHAPSHVLLAMGLDARAASSSLRLSLSRETTDAEVDRAIEAVCDSVASLRALAAP